jgi:8-oxo-dGTP diphosphatase
MNRRFGRPPLAGQRYTPRPGVYAIIDAGDGILATFQEEPWPELQLPGGGIDPGESPQSRWPAR